MSRFEVKTQWEARGEIDSTINEPKNQLIFIYDNKKGSLTTLTVQEVLELWNQLYDAQDRASKVAAFPVCLKSILLPWSSKEGVLRVINGEQDSALTDPQDSKLYQGLVDRMVDVCELKRSKKGFLSVTVS